MKTNLVELLTRKTVVAVQLLLATLAVLLVWLFNSFGGGEALLSSEDTLFVRVTHYEFLLVLMLLVLNVGAAHAIFRQFQALNRSVKWSTGLMIVSLLALITWIGRLFLFQGVEITVPTEVSAGVGRVELVLALILILANMMAGVMIFRRYKNVEPFVVISAYSKKVQYKGGWITIEEYLLKELGIHVSHGITPEEKDQALAKFREDLKRDTASAAAPGIGGAQAAHGK